MMPTDAFTRAAEFDGDHHHTKSLATSNAAAQPYIARLPLPSASAAHPRCTSLTEPLSRADMSLSLSPSPAMCHRAVFATTSNSSPPPAASLFYSGHGHIPHSCSASVLQLSQSNMSLVDADRRPARSLPACPPRSTPGATTRLSMRAVAAPSSQSSPLPVPPAPLVAKTPEPQFDELQATACGVFTVGGCAVRQLPRYAIVPTTGHALSRKDVLPVGSSLSDPPSSSSGSPGLCGASGGTSTALADKLPLEWSSEDEDGFADVTESDFWESARSTEDHLLLHTGVTAHLVTRDGARRSFQHRLP